VHSYAAYAARLCRILGGERRFRISCGFERSLFFSHLIQLKILGLWRIEQTDEGHDRTHRKNHGRREPQILLLNGGDKRNLMSPPHIRAEPGAQQRPGGIPETNTGGAAPGWEALTEIRGNNSAGSYELYDILLEANFVEFELFQDAIGNSD
jgi:hypothetical protein